MKYKQEQRRHLFPVGYCHHFDISLLLSFCLSQRKSGKNDLLPTAGQEGTLPQL